MATPPLMPPRDMLDIIFADRNRSYGAYALRREYPDTLGRALGVTLLLIVALLILPRILAAFSDPVSAAAPPESIVYDPGPPPNIERLQPPLRIETPLPRQLPVLRFVPVTVRPDDDAPDQPTSLSPDDITTNVGAITDPGDPDAPPADLPASQDHGIVESPPAPPDDQVHNLTDVQKLPAFPGGEAELMRFLAKNIRYPELARANNIQGVAALSFVVGKDGTISEVSVLKEPGGGCGKEAVRVVQNMPRWTPGEANGHPVRVRFTLPVRFRLQ